MVVVAQLSLRLPWKVQEGLCGTKSSKLQGAIAADADGIGVPSLRGWDHWALRQPALQESGGHRAGAGGETSADGRQTGA